MNKQEIVELLQTNDKAIARALVVLNERQTAAERGAEQTINLNGEGFTPADARMGTSMAQFYTKRGYLTEKQLAYWKKPNVKGTWRICKYAGQLLLIANAKAAAKKSQAALQPVDDVGNMAEELMVLEERLAHETFEYNMYLDSDDEAVLVKMELAIVQLQDRIDTLKKEIARAYKEMA